MLYSAGCHNRVIRTE
jgi:hypothetical protein